MTNGFPHNPHSIALHIDAEFSLILFYISIQTPYLEQRFCPNMLENCDSIFVCPKMYDALMNYLPR